VPSAEKTPGNPFQPPYLVIIDFGNPQRAKYAGRGALAPACHPPTGSGWSTTL
jgi:inosose dehydratase